MGKKKRNLYIMSRHISYIKFLPEWIYGNRICKIGDIKVVPRKGTDDAIVFFINEREQGLENHIMMGKNEIFVDVGANVGSYCLRIAKGYKGLGSTVIAIEPNRGNYDALCKNIKCNKLDNIQTINKAVSDHKGQVEMYEYFDESGDHNFTGQFSVVNSFKENEKISPKTSRVECDTLDNLVGNCDPNVLKVDVEGAEVEVLRGADRTLRTLRKIIIEIHSEEAFVLVKKILQEYKYTCNFKAGSMPHIIGTRN